MRAINSKRRRWAIGIAIGVMAVLVWWLRVFSPLEDKKRDISTEIEKESLELHHLKKELKKILSAITAYRGKNGNGKRFSHVFTGAKTLEGTNAAVQAGFQKFLEDNHISLIAYKELPPGKWRAYAVGRLEFRLSASIEDLSRVLRYLETQKGATRIERIVISYRSRRNEGLHVLLRLGTLFVDKAGWN